MLSHSRTTPSRTLQQASVTSFSLTGRWPLAVCLTRFHNPNPNHVFSLTRGYHTQAGFVDVQVEAIEHGTWVENAETLLTTLRWFLGKMLEGEAGERFLTESKEKYGEGEFILKGWRLLVVTGTKPE